MPVVRGWKRSEACSSTIPHHNEVKIRRHFGREGRHRKRRELRIPAPNIKDSVFAFEILVMVILRFAELGLTAGWSSQISGARVSKFSAFQPVRSLQSTIFRYRGQAWLAKNLLHVSGDVISWGSDDRV